MPVADHIVSFRNGSQIMVRGTALVERLGYCRDARVQVTDPACDPYHEPWVFTVPNDEHATLSCGTPPPPDWIQQGVAIRIDVEPPLEAADALMPVAVQSVPAALPTARDADQAVATKQVLDLPPHVVYAIDVGSPAGGLAWARLAPREKRGFCGSMNFADFLDILTQDLRSHYPVALGFEAPLFVPVVPDYRDLTRARLLEPSAWSFGAGAYVTAVALPLIGYVLRHIRDQFDPTPRVTLNPADWMAPDDKGPHLFLWEAFVWGPGHARSMNAAGLETHVQDAGTAVQAFAQWEGTQPRPRSDVTARNPLSTVGAAVLWSKLSNDVTLLHQAVLVLRPLQVLGTGITAYEPPAA